MSKHEYIEQEHHDTSILLLNRQITDLKEEIQYHKDNIYKINHLVYELVMALKLAVQFAEETAESPKGAHLKWDTLDYVKMVLKKYERILK